MRYYTWPIMSILLVGLVPQVTADFLIVAAQGNNTLLACPEDGDGNASCQCFSSPSNGVSLTGVNVADAFTTSQFKINSGLCGEGLLDVTETTSGGVSQLNVYGLGSTQIELVATCTGITPGEFVGGQCDPAPAWNQFWDCSSVICS
jgi:hypothetical protein